MVFSANDPSEIYYSTIGTAPYRKFVISFYEGRIAGCTERASSQIVLHETTNVIEVFVDKKPTPCPTRKFENALIGVINADGTLSVSPPNRNTGVWQALQEGYRFNPLGNAIQPDVTWTNPQDRRLLQEFRQQFALPRMKCIRQLRFLIPAEPVP
jgi:hypothetical protein